MKIVVFINSYYINVPKPQCVPMFASSILEFDDSFPGHMSIIFVSYMTVYMDNIKKTVPEIHTK